MSYIYKEDDIPSKYELVTLYHALEWFAYTKDEEQLYQAVRNSLKVITVYKNEKLIGLIRGVGDGHTILYIQDILVLPEYQRKGIGSKLFHILVDQYPHVRQKVLLTDNTEKTKQFYEAMGFSSVNDVNCLAFIKNF
jgi:ribosomal protein S18 acetylase RimI-like enzyme